jgi:hypothetical protein
MQVHDYLSQTLENGSYVKHVAPLECSKEEGLEVEGQITLLLMCSIGEKSDHS